MKFGNAELDEYQVQALYGTLKLIYRKMLDSREPDVIMGAQLVKSMIDLMDEARRPAGHTLN